MQKVVNKTVKMWVSEFNDYPIGALLKFQEVAPLYGWKYSEILKVINQATDTRGGKSILSVLRLYCEE